MGAVTNSAVVARGRVQRRSAAQLASVSERESRIAAAAARAASAQDAIRANGERRALAVAAAERAIAAAEQAERDVNAVALVELLAAVRALRGDRLTVAGIAELLELPVPRVRQLVKQANTAGDAGVGVG